MSWEDFQRHRTEQREQQREQAREPKRRRLFPSGAETKLKHGAKDNEFIASFDSDSDNGSPKKPRRFGGRASCPYNPRQVKKPRTAGSSEKQRSGISIILPKPAVSLSPVNIDSFESDSSTYECTPPRKHDLSFNKEKKQLSNKDVLCREKVAIKTVKLGFEPKFDSSFSDLAEELKLDDVETPTKRSAAVWLNSIKSPDIKPEKSEDKSAKKLLAKKHPVGSLAHKAQSMIRYNRGEYLMWLHKNIHSSKRPPFNESCFFGMVLSESVEMKHSMLCVSARSCDSRQRCVRVLIPGDKKCGEFATHKLLVVFPEFHCFIRGSENIVLALFHAQFFDKDCFDFDSIPKCDHFLGITENPTDQQDITPPLSDVEKTVTLPREMSSSYPVDVHVCVYHLRVAEDHVEILCCDASSNIILIEVAVNLAQQYWYQLSLSLATTCYFTSLQLQHVAPAYKCFAWYPQLRMFSVGCQRKVYCFDMLTGSVRQQGDIAYLQHMVISENRSDLMCKFLGCISNMCGRTVSYVLSLFGTIQWIEHDTPFPALFHKGTCIKFSNLKSNSPMHYKFDDQSIVSTCFLDKTLNISYPNLYTYATEEELAMSTTKMPRLLAFNQYLPHYSPCTVKLTVSAVTYADNEYRVEGVSCGVTVNVILYPATVRRLLGTSSIVSSHLNRLKGRECVFKGVVHDKCRIVEHELNFFD